MKKRKDKKDFEEKISVKSRNNTFVIALTITLCVLITISSFLIADSHTYYNGSGDQNRNYILFNNKDDIIVMNMFGEKINLHIPKIDKENPLLSKASVLIPPPIRAIIYPINSLLRWIREFIVISY